MTNLTYLNIFQAVGLSQFFEKLWSISNVAHEKYKYSYIFDKLYFNFYFYTRKYYIGILCSDT